VQIFPRYNRIITVAQAVVMVISSNMMSHKLRLKF